VSYKGFKHSEEAKEKMKLVHLGKRHSKETIEKMSESHKGDKNHNFGKHFSEETRKKQSDSNKGRYVSEETRKKISEANKGKHHSEETIMKRSKMLRSKRGGYHSLNIPTYDLYSKRLEYAEKVRRNEDNPNILEVLCSGCKKKWFVPTASTVISRINALEGRAAGELRLYCSEECKHKCPVYRKRWYSANQERPENRSREVQAELKAMVLERDEYTCIKCGSKEKLECHHIEGIHHEPMESADMDVCVTFCEVCHDAAHKEKGCTYDDMKCKIEDREIFVPPIDKPI
jgi:5-methylcytosine-specific restriction endonuclease McrA